MYCGTVSTKIGVGEHCLEMVHKYFRFICNFGENYKSKSTL